MINTRNVLQEPPSDPKEYAALLKVNLDERAIFFLRLEVFFQDFEAFKSRPDIIRQRADHFLEKFQQLLQLSVHFSKDEFPELFDKMAQFRENLAQANIHIHFPRLN